ncbi:MAG: urease subunit gamma [Peptococcaceae bacterium]|jgi:urease gamma subunit|nr:urease subunit gamma [Peptococcaceae bacterium]
MRLTPKEEERLTIFTIAEMSRRRLRRGIRLNYIEATAIICDELMEQAREGKKMVADLISLGSRILTEEDVMEDTAVLMPEIQVEALFPDGTKLVTIHQPIRLEKREEREQDLITLDAALGGYV